MHKGKGMKTSLLILANLLFLSGCSQNNIAEKSSHSSQANLSQQQSPATFMLRGNVTIASNAQTIQPCGSNQQYWINLSPAQWKAASDIQQSPNQLMYAELIGYFEAPPKGGFANDYPARLVVSQINSLVAGEGGSCNRKIQPTQAFAAEPFWKMQVVNNQLVFSQLGQAKRSQPIIKQTVENNTRYYQSQDYSLSMTKGICRDTMVESVYGWHSSVDLDGKKYQGCATLSAADSHLDWVGSYQGTSTTGSEKLTITLRLNPDHSATTTYSYDSKEPQRVETGVWQITKDNQLYVLMSRHQYQYLISERIFTKNGDQISTEKETINGKTFSIQSGLTLYQTNNK